MYNSKSYLSGLFTVVKSAIKSYNETVMVEKLVTSDQMSKYKHVSPSQYFDFNKRFDTETAEYLMTDLDDAVEFVINTLNLNRVIGDVLVDFIFETTIKSALDTHKLKLSISVLEGFKPASTINIAEVIKELGKMATMGVSGINAGNIIKRDLAKKDIKIIKQN